MVGHLTRPQSLPSQGDAVIVESSDIPILSSTDRLQRALLRWVDICGLSGQFMAQSDVVDALASHDLLDDRTYLVEIDGQDPSGWTVHWTGSSVMFGVSPDFGGALHQCIPDERFINLVVQEYIDANRYRRASARRFAHRNQTSIDTMDQLIFPVRGSCCSDYVLVVGEAVAGRTVYASGPTEAGGNK